MISASTLKADHWILWSSWRLLSTGAPIFAAPLHVLDCNADNFIALPVTLAYLSAIIEGLLTTP